jgi:hypothetical protein
MINRKLTKTETKYWKVINTFYNESSKKSTQYKSPSQVCNELRATNSLTTVCKLLGFIKKVKGKYMWVGGRPQYEKHLMTVISKLQEYDSKSRKGVLKNNNTRPYPDDIHEINFENVNDILIIDEPELSDTKENEVSGVQNNDKPYIVLTDEQFKGIINLNKKPSLYRRMINFFFGE